MFNKVIEKMVRRISEGVNFLVIDKLDNLNKRIDDNCSSQKEFELRIEKRLNDCHKEFIDKYFDSINQFMRWNKDISLVAHLSKQSPDLEELKQEMMKPLLDEKWKQKEAEQAERIENILSTRGERIRKLRNTLYDKMLIDERENRDVVAIKAQLEILDGIMGDSI